jgi:hypothetical protein
LSLRRDKKGIRTGIRAKGKGQRQQRKDGQQGNKRDVNGQQGKATRQGKDKTPKNERETGKS